jgi:hypothetical protein
MSAAHCLGWTAEGWMALDDTHEQIRTAAERELTVTVLFLDPVADVAVLGPPDGQVYSNEAEPFGTFCGETPPVPLAIRQYELGRQFPGHIFTHNKGVLPTRMGLFQLGGASFAFESGTPIDGGTSGGPVVDGVTARSSNCLFLGKVDGQAGTEWRERAGLRRGPRVAPPPDGARPTPAARCGVPAGSVKSGRSARTVANETPVGAASW